MILLRLFHWAFRIPCLPALDEHGQYSKKLRPPHFFEAVTGISGT